MLDTFIIERIRRERENRESGRIPLRIEDTIPLHPPQPRQQKKDDAKFVAAKFGNFVDSAAKDKNKSNNNDEADDSSDDEDARNALGRKPPRQRTAALRKL